MAKDAICFICENLYDSIEEAEVCERSHDAEAEREAVNPRQRGDDDGVEYGHPGDRLAGRE